MTLYTEVTLTPKQSAECLVPSGAFPTTFLCFRRSDSRLSGLVRYWYTKYRLVEVYLRCIIHFYMHTYMECVFSTSMRVRVSMFARGVHPRPGQLLAVAWRVATFADRRPLAGINVTGLMMSPWQVSFVRFLWPLLCVRNSVTCEWFL